MSRKGSERVTATRFCGELFVDYCKDTDARMKEVFAEAVYDYRDLVSYIKSRGADPALKTAYYKQELD